MSGPVTKPVDRSTRLRVPSLGAGGLEAALAAANQRGRQDALDDLEPWFPHLDLDRIGQHADGATFSVGPGTPGVDPPIDGRRLLDELLTWHDLGDIRLKLLKETERIDGAQVTRRLRPDGMCAERAASGTTARAMDDGHTLVFDGIDLRLPEVGRLSERFERIFDCQVNVNAYASLRSHRSFGAHWDDHEVVILQLLGRKRWQVHSPLTLSPHQAIHDSATSGDVVWDGVIEPGTVLHLPRGWGHDVTGLNELTVHLTITIPRWSVLGLIQASLAHLHDLEGGVAIVDGSHRETTPEIHELTALLASAMQPQRIDEVTATTRATVRSRPTQAVTDLVAVLSGRTAVDTLAVRAPHGGGVMVGESDGARVVLAFGGRSAAIGVEVAPTLLSLLDGRTHRLEEVVAPVAEPDRAREAILGALRCGLLEVADPRSAHSS